MKKFSRPLHVSMLLFSLFLLCQKHWKEFFFLILVRLLISRGEKSNSLDTFRFWLSSKKLLGFLDLDTFEDKINMSSSILFCSIKLFRISKVLKTMQNLMFWYWCWILFNILESNCPWLQLKEILFR